ncbi:hypothetical protein M0R45_022132 [Rubus argutus]|uniref:Ninja-family protein n=1 Tax=Rubus argutus TaxID=59490 RepID=A0AAW1XDR0_RUBAR
MEEGSEGRRRAMENMSSYKYPRDLLQRLMCSGNTQAQYAVAEAEEELELSLGLSLGGRFGVDKTSNNKLVRSSSIAGTMPFHRESDSPAPAQAASYAGLMRASSLPTETEDEWRKRKELQTLRRLAAKRRRSEKQRNKDEDERRELDDVVGPNYSSCMPFWAAAAAAARQAVVGGDPLAKGKNDILGGFQGFGLQPTSQGSVESHGGSSSGLSELESTTLQGSSSCGEARSPAGNQLLQDQRTNQDTAFGSSGSLTPQNASRISKADIENMYKKPNPSGNKERQNRMNAMEDMPCVFTKGDGPNGRKIEGILYRYGKGEEVRIMCEGGDVTHPLRHIVVNPAATSFL